MTHIVTAVCSHSGVARSLAFGRNQTLQPQATRARQRRPTTRSPAPGARWPSWAIPQYRQRHGRVQSRHPRGAVHPEAEPAPGSCIQPGQVGGVRRTASHRCWPRVRQERQVGASADHASVECGGQRDASVNKRMRRINPSVDPAQPAPAKPRRGCAPAVQ
jgi:hypothetical protein